MYLCSNRQAAFTAKLWSLSWTFCLVSRARNRICLAVRIHMHTYSGVRGNTPFQGRRPVFSRWQVYMLPCAGAHFAWSGRARCPNRKGEDPAANHDLPGGPQDPPRYLWYVLCSILYSWWSSYFPSSELGSSKVPTGSGVPIARVTVESVTVKSEAKVGTYGAKHQPDAEKRRVLLLGYDGAYKADIGRSVPTVPAQPYESLPFRSRGEIACTDGSVSFFPPLLHKEPGTRVANSSDIIHAGCSCGN